MIQVSLTLWVNICSFSKFILHTKMHKYSGNGWLVERHCQRAVTPNRQGPCTHRAYNLPSESPLNRDGNKWWTTSFQIKMSAIKRQKGLIWYCDRIGHETLNRMFSEDFSSRRQLSRNGKENQQMALQGAMLIGTTFLDGKLMKVEGKIALTQESLLQELSLWI